MFFYEKWEVFKALVELREIIRELADKYRGMGLANDFSQAERAASSGILNLGEGAKSRKKGHKIERYESTLGSVGEINACFVWFAKVLPNEPLVLRGLRLCDAIAGMMTNLIKSVEKNWRSRRPLRPEDGQDTNENPPPSQPRPPPRRNR